MWPCRDSEQDTGLSLNQHKGLNHLKENLKLSAYVGASFLFVLFCFTDAVCFRGLNIQAVKEWAFFVFSTKVLCS